MFHRRFWHDVDFILLLRDNSLLRIQNITPKTDVLFSWISPLFQAFVQYLHITANRLCYQHINHIVLTTTKPSQIPTLDGPACFPTINRPSRCPALDHAKFVPSFPLPRSKKCFRSIPIWLHLVVKLRSRLHNAIDPHCCQTNQWLPQSAVAFMHSLPSSSTMMYCGHCISLNFRCQHLHWLDQPPSHSVATLHITLVYLIYCLGAAYILIPRADSIIDNHPKLSNLTRQCRRS